jgi:hypothetical protein
MLAIGASDSMRCVWRIFGNFEMSTEFDQFVAAFKTFENVGATGLGISGVASPYGSCQAGPKVGTRVR